MWRGIRRLSIIIGVASVTGCQLHAPVPDVPDPTDLAITHAALLEVRTGRVVPETTVLATNGLITGVYFGSRVPRYRAARTIDARGRLLTPGLIDSHLHTHLLFGDSSTTAGLVNGPLSMEPDSIARYRRGFADAYLPYGVTAVRDVGSDEHYLPMLVAWTHRSPDAPDFYPSGAYLVSAEAGRSPVPFAVAVSDSAAAAAKVREYYAKGLRNIKLYWRLRPSAFHGALLEAQRLGMNVTAHIDQQVMTIDQALDMGLRNVEHVHTLAISVMSREELAAFYQGVPATLGVTSPQSPGFFYQLIPEFWNHLGPSDPRLLASLTKLSADSVILTPTLHVFAGPLGLAYFPVRSWRPQDDASGLTPQQRERAIAGYRIMASYVKRMHDSGTRLAVGTDALDPGKAVLSEMLLLHDAGIPMADVFQIATLNSAIGIGQGKKYGSIVVGKRADMILFERSPLSDAQNLIGKKLVIKDGVEWAPHS